MIVTGAVTWIDQDDETHVFATVRDRSGANHCIGFARGTAIATMAEEARAFGDELRIACAQTRDGPLATLASDAVVTWRTPRLGESGEYGVHWGPIRAADNVVAVRLAQPPLPTAAAAARIAA